LGPAKVRVTFGLGMGDRKTGVEFLSGAQILLFAGTLIQVLGAHPACYIISIGYSFLGTKRPG